MTTPVTNNKFDQGENSINLLFTSDILTKTKKGIGKKLMEHVIEVTEGNIALHCEPDNPAFHLYEKLGFKNKYLEMRLEKSN